MPLLFSALSALLVTAGCATTVPIPPAAKPRVVHDAKSTAVTAPTKTDTASQTPGATKQKAPPRDAEPTVLAAAGISPAAPTAPRDPTGPIDPALATKPPSTPTPSTPKADPFGDVGFKEVNEKEWLAGIRDKIAQRENVAPTDLRISPGLLRAVFVRSSPLVLPARPGKRVPPRRHEIVVVDNQGRRVASFRPIGSRGSDEPPGDVRFLSDERLVYEVIRAPAAPPRVAKKPPAIKSKDHSAARAMVTAVPPTPPRLFVIQPLAPRARPIRCEGFNFTFTRGLDRLAFVGGQAGAGFVAVDGAQVYPRRGRTIVASAPVWSKDGHSMAFLELPAAHPARLVLLAEVDNATGDMTWDLPVDAKIDGASVFWAGAGKLIVRKTAMRPIFSASFVKER